MSDTKPDIMPRMGGIALRNGLILVSEDNWAAAVRQPDGTIGVASVPGGGSRFEVVLPRSAPPAPAP